MHIGEITYLTNTGNKKNSNDRFRTKNDAWHIVSTQIFVKLGINAYKNIKKIRKKHTTKELY